MATSPPATSTAAEAAPLRRTRSSGTGTTAAVLAGLAAAACWQTYVALVLVFIAAALVTIVMWLAAGAIASTLLRAPGTATVVALILAGVGTVAFWMLVPGFFALPMLYAAAAAVLTRAPAWVLAAVLAVGYASWYAVHLA